MFNLEPVDFHPFNVTLTPVEHDPFASAGNQSQQPPMQLAMSDDPGGMKKILPDTGFGGGGATRYYKYPVPNVLPSSEMEINPNTKVDVGTLYRGTATGVNPDTLDRPMLGDLGHGVYATPSEEIAGSYGGGPTASVKAGTRTVHQYQLKNPLYPEDVAYVFGGAKYGEDARLVSGNGIELWRGDPKGVNFENALRVHEGIKMVIGTPGSIGFNQISIRDPSILKIVPK